MSGTFKSYPYVTLIFSALASWIESPGSRPDDIVRAGLEAVIGDVRMVARDARRARVSEYPYIGMRYPIDVVFLDRAGCVLRICSHVKAGRMRWARGARGALELRSGVAAGHGLVPGLQLVELVAAL
jgi:Uncharacterized ACR, COG1430